MENDEEARGEPESGEHSEQTRRPDPEYVRNQAYYQALQNHYQAVRDHHHQLMYHHELLLDHHYIVQALYKDVLKSHRGRSNKEQSWQSYQIALKETKEIVEDNNRIHERHRKMN